MPRPSRRAAAAAPAPAPSTDGQRRRERRAELRLARRRANRVRAWRRSQPGSGHRPRRPRDQEGHPRLHRVGRDRRAPAAPAEAATAPAEAPAAPPEAPPAAAPAQPAPAAQAPAAQGAAPAPVETGVGEQVEPMTAMRKGIAEHMRRSLDTSAHVTSAIEVDMSRVVAIREKLKPEFQKSYGVNPTYLDLRRARGHRDAARVPVDQRRDARRQDRHAQLRQPRLRGRARRGQGPDRAGASRTPRA